MPIELEVAADGVALLTLNRPERLNALDPEHYALLSRAFERVRDDPAIRACVVTGAGERAFCTGADLKAPMPRLGPAEMAMTQRDLLPNRGMQLWKPLVAAVNGHCLAGGMCLLLACDIRLAAPHATFGLSEVRRGLIAGNGGTVRAGRDLPHALAMELLLTGDAWDAARAERWGLVNRVVPMASLLEEALAAARRIAANAPLAVQAAKEVALRARDLPLDDALRLEQAMLALLATTEDRAEGVRAFTEKRAPAFAGR
ncbi:enoyl-CoA hydratase/isomerase family protein [Roseococcus sp. DSY-14]|uniref:enoyl-CoA hydratase/isomerase family protein n=1 Tax=Roseococcus sp. DSY-14 TaxID=3369650 RepID=UPI00387B3A17